MNENRNMEMMEENTFVLSRSVDSSAPRYAMRPARTNCKMRTRESRRQMIADRLCNHRKYIHKTKYTNRLNAREKNSRACIYPVSCVYCVACSHPTTNGDMDNASHFNYKSSELDFVSVFILLQFFVFASKVCSMCASTTK